MKRTVDAINKQKIMPFSLSRNLTVLGAGYEFFGEKFTPTI
jgi:hypothetical protein